MSNVVKLSDARKTHSEIRAQALLFLARLDAGATPENIQQIENWLAESSLHRKVFLKMANLWDATTVLSSLCDVIPLSEYSMRTVRWKYIRPWAAACALLLAFLGSWVVIEKIDSSANNSAPSEPPARQHAVTKNWKHTSIGLTDNSKFMLNTNIKSREPLNTPDRLLAFMQDRA